MAEDRWVIRRNCEYSKVVVAATAADAVAAAIDRPDEEWEQAWSETTAEAEDGGDGEIDEDLQVFLPVKEGNDG